MRPPRSLSVRRAWFLPRVEGLEARRLMAVPAGFAQSQIASGLSSPSAIEAAPDGRLFVTLQNGTVRVVKNGAMLPTPFATVNEDSTAERGLLGITFDPDFATNQYVYVYYTKDDPAPLVSHNVVSRFTASGDVAVPGSETVLFELPDVGSAIWHMGGAMHFGPDGKLYVAVGDYQQPNSAQSIATPTGKILRINKDGTIPTDNPFYNQTSGVNRAIWALGLRNPFTTAFQPGTGRFYINDVGQGSFEEVNEGAAGRNFGWPTTEGAFNAAQHPNFTNPIYTYPHSDGVCVIGGAFYNGVTPAFPAQYHGKYFVADFGSGWIRTIDPATRAVGPFGTGFSFPVGMTLAPDGSLWVLTRGQQTGGLPNTGGLWKVQYTQNQPPQISEHPEDALVTVGSPASFTVTAGGSPPLSYQWQRNQVNIPGATSSSYTLATTTAADEGARFRVVVTSPFGAATSNEAVLHVTTDNVPVATITSPAPGTTYGGGQTIQFAGTGTDVEDGTLPAGAFTWRVDLHHDVHSHPLMPPTSGIISGSFVIPTIGETSANVWYRIHLTVRDSAGLTHSVFRDIQPRTATVNLLSNVPGATVLVDGQPRATPLPLVGVEGIQRSFEAPALQFAAGATQQFLSWAHQPGTSFTTPFPAADTTWLALFRTVGTAYLSDMTPVGTVVNGWGPAERDRSNGEQAAGDGRPITLGGIAYPKGLGVHANSEQVFDLGGRFSRFLADVGVDDEVGSNGSVVVEVWADNTRLYQSAVLTGASATVPVSVDVTGRRQLRLVVTTAGNGDGYDHADWADARLVAAATPVARVNFTATGAEAVGGYAADTGAVFGARAGGLSYGWLADVAPHTRDRDAANSPDERYDSLVHLQKDGRSDVWEIAVPVGNYLVHLVGGDPSSVADTIRLTAEGVLVGSGTTTADSHWVEGRSIVRVTDGRLTVTNGAGAVNNKVNFIEIDRLDESPATPPASSPFTATASSSGRVDLNWGAVPFAGGYVLRRTGGAGGAVTRVLSAGATSFSDQGLAPDTSYTYSLTAYDPRGESPAVQAAATTFPLISVAGRWVFYNGSGFDRNGSAVDDRDLAAIATDKAALLPGGGASLANYTSYTKGINGVLVDLAGVSPATTLTAADFEFRSGRIGDPLTWPLVSATPTVTRLAGLTAAHGGRFAISFPDGSIRNRWLRVTVRATANTGLSAADVFFLGNLVGDAGPFGPAGASVDGTDVVATRSHVGRTVATITSLFDHNRDGRVNARDVDAVRSRVGTTLPPIGVTAAVLSVMPRRKRYSLFGA